jgi:hypothetical protein
LARASAPVLFALALIAVGCGGGGAPAGAEVSVYAAAPLCAEAQTAVKAADAKAVDLRVRVVCLSPVERGGGADLSTAGRNARRATEDATAVAYVEAPGPAAGFSHSIVEAADLAWLKTDSGSKAAERILAALEANSSSPRQAVLDEVG